MLTRIRTFFKRILSFVYPSYFRKRLIRQHINAFENNQVDIEFEVLKQLLTPQSCVLDIGANNGEYCYFFQEISKVNKVYAFEPIPSLFKKLNETFPSIQVSPYAISNDNRQTKLYIPYIAHQRFETRAKLDPIKEVGETKNQEITVETKTLDSLFLASSEKIDFLKIDIEGHELQAIQGARQLIKRDLPKMMIEIEHRHHKEEFWNVINEIKGTEYQCYFYDISIKQVVEISQFDLEKHQNSANKEQYYIHNLFFFPMHYSIESLNKKLNNAL